MNYIGYSIILVVALGSFLTFLIIGVSKMEKMQGYKALEDDLQMKWCSSWRRKNER